MTTQSTYAEPDRKLVTDAITFDHDGLVAAVAQQHDTGEVLMVAWMNREAVEKTLSTGMVHYWSRSRAKLWRKGEESGHTQSLVDFRIDCDGDTVLLLVDQAGVACHTGRESCYFLRLEDGRWQPVDPVLKDPALIYREDT